MGLNNLDNAMKLEEIASQHLLHQAIDNKTNFIYEAGAGAGKTYALKESINHILDNHSSILSKKNQKILCITFTNLAANDLIKRIGNTELVEIGTIHEKFWSIISLQQNALKLIHKNKIEKTIDTLTKKFNDDEKLQQWLHQGIKDTSRLKFIDFLRDNRTREEFYRARRNENLIDVFSEKISAYGYTLYRNSKKFEDAFTYFNKVKDLDNGLLKIRSAETTNVIYTPDLNYDKLHQMKISHDTLLEYAYELFEKYPLMRDLFTGKYPYVFIDEYQDTNEYIIKLLLLTSSHSTLENGDFCIGCFGDRMQNIYSSNAGWKLLDENEGFLKIIKRQNRRSYHEIITVFDKLRDDELHQKSIYTDSLGGKFKYYQVKVDSSEKETIDKIKEEFYNDFNIDSGQQVNYLVMKNKTIASLLGFENYYANLESLFYYNDAATYLLSSDFNKLHNSIRKLHSAINFITLSKNNGKNLKYILPKSLNKFTWEESRQFLSELESLHLNDNNTLKECICTAFDMPESKGIIYNLSLEEHFAFLNGNYSFDSLTNSLHEEIAYHSKASHQKIKEKIEVIFNLPIKEIIGWFNYINNERVIFTCHGSKGLEFENVIVFITDEFSKENKYLSNFFDNMGEENYRDRRNLLYVSLSRAIKNLAVVFLYNNLEPSQNLTHFFSELVKEN